MQFKTDKLHLWSQMSKWWLRHGKNSRYYLEGGIKEACRRGGNIPYFELDRVCTGTLCVKNHHSVCLNLYTLLNINYASIKEKNGKIMLIDCRMGYVTHSEGAKDRNDWSRSNCW